jgi:hypothetical protein
MLTATPPLRIGLKATQGSGFAHWLQTHRGAIAMAGMLAFAGPVAFFTGTLSVMRAPAAVDLVRLGLWWILYGVLLWSLMLITGYGCERIARHFGRTARGVAAFMAACLAAAPAGILTAGRMTILIEQGVVHSAGTAHLYAFIFSLIIALLYLRTCAAAASTNRPPSASPPPRWRNATPAAASLKRACRKCKRASIHNCCSKCWTPCVACTTGMSRRESAFSTN